MAMPADGNVTAVVKNEVFGIINFVPLIYYEKSATRNVFLRKKKRTLGESTFINLLLHFWTDLA